MLGVPFRKADFVNLMTFDLSGSEAGITTHHSPLYPSADLQTQSVVIIILLQYCTTYRNRVLTDTV